MRTERCPGSFGRSAVEGATRVSWKYGCSRGNFGTPGFLVNGVAVEADPSWTLGNWTSLLDPLLA